MKKIPLSQNRFALVDDDVFDFLSKWKWYFNDGYASRKGEDKKHILMHRIIINAPKGMFVDHINGNPLDNRRKNLRLCSHSTNAMNMRKHKGVSKYKGVCREKNSWRVQIWKDNKKVFSAMAPNEQWAGMIYNLNAPALFGDFARLNFGGAIVSIVLHDCAVNLPSGDSHSV